MAVMALISVRDKMVVLIKVIILVLQAVAVAAGMAAPMVATIVMPFRPAVPVAPVMFMPPLPILEESSEPAPVTVTPASPSCRIALVNKNRLYQRIFCSSTVRKREKARNVFSGAFLKSSSTKPSTQSLKSGSTLKSRILAPKLIYFLGRSKHSEKYVLT